ncbi:MAG: hypothetical protein JO257_05100 [Deltaproteobacteria bacterium]|nr:hypothetical protein [Deltaproteobacteria bacterium]
MATKPRLHPPAGKHGELTEVLPGIYFVTGTVKLPGPLPVRFSRNMTVVKQGDRLVVVNSVRLDDAGLAALDKLGKVTDVVRLAANHGMDDPFYAERYGAKVWAVKGQRYTAGFNTSRPDTYFTPHHEMDATTELPIAGAKLTVIDSTPSEGLLVLDGGTIISGDCLQNWAAPDAYMSGLGKFMLKRMGFMKPHNIGPGWLRQGKPPHAQLRALLDLPFVNVLPVHGTPVLGDAPALYKPAIERVTVTSKGAAS